MIHSLWTHSHPLFAEHEWRPMSTKMQVHMNKETSCINTHYSVYFQLPCRDVVCFVGWMGGWAWSDFLPALGFGPSRRIRSANSVEQLKNWNIQSNDWKQSSWSCIYTANKGILFSPKNHDRESKWIQSNFLQTANKVIITNTIQTAAPMSRIRIKFLTYFNNHLTQNFRNVNMKTDV